ncbi:hypothetical protein BJ878DRAFT_243805 [Calycina marina]|uniref:CAP-Gly domain-containing protein n=1 Tax=Calycina marina TaxID=1763456 RepID=A0A9P8CBQ3_9HELO|nr:hypothetical protein BJ878DRAFT_243805 [Calycina marina]
MSTFTPRRSLAPRSSFASSPNLSAVYSLEASSQNRPTLPNLTRKSSLSALTSQSLSTIPNERNYGLSALKEDTSSSARMPPYTPGRGGEDLDLGDVVDVPGSMHGTVKFVGNVQGKKGTFAGVELSEQFAFRGKNNGDVDGRSYFETTIAGAGIFLPINRATRRSSQSSHEDSFPLTPSTPSMGGGFKVASVGEGYTPPTPSVPKFSQSVGPGRAPSPHFKKSRPSLPRPESPLRRPHIGARPSIGTPVSKVPARYGSPAPNKFGQSVRGTQDSRDPSKKPGFAPRTVNGRKTPVSGPRSASALGNAPMNYSDEDTTPVGNARAINDSVSSISSFNAKMRPASRTASRANNDEVDRLRGQLEERDRQLKDQASSLAEMENSLNEVQSLMDGSDGGKQERGNSMEDKDSPQLRALLREKNEKISMLTAEFDAHRADFRSTIDTLELASTETERVYEKRVEELIAEVKELQERSEDVDSVAQQLNQLTELVQELEDGLEDARRGEAEARGEVEFLRGEVERTRSELRREREKAAASINVNGNNGDAASRDGSHKDDEIRGLKAIIHSLSRDAVPDANDPQKTPTHRTRHVSSGTAEMSEDRQAREKLERDVKELRALVESKGNREEELERELEQARGSSAGPPNQRASAMTIASNGTVTQDQASVRDSRGTVVSWRDRERPRSPETHRRGNTLDTMPESDAYSSAAESFCELCETSGHDILTCTNMFPSGGNANRSPPQKTGKDAVEKGLRLLTQDTQQEFTPAPLTPLKKSPDSTPIRLIPNPIELGPVAGKESGIINMQKWCGVCERDGHDSIDCPFEDTF